MTDCNSYTRRTAPAATVKAGGIDLVLYRPIVGGGWWTPATPIFDLAGIAEEDHLDFRRCHHLTSFAFGFELAFTYPEHVELLSAVAVAAVLANARTPVDDATAKAISEALAG